MSDKVVTENGKRVIKLIFVSEKNNNKFYNFQENGDGTFTVEYGRVDHTSTSKTYPMSKWNTLYRQKTKKGYKDVTDLFVEESEEQDQDINSPEIQDRVVRKLMDDLQRFANKTIQRNYKVSSRSVTQAMIDEAQSIVDRLASSCKIGTDKKTLNDDLLKLYSVIPRKMKNVRNHLFQEDVTKDNHKEYLELIQEEQDTLDTMAGQVLKNTAKDKDDEETPGQDHDLLTMLGLEIKEGTKEDYDLVKKMMDYKDPGKSSKCKKVFKVVNKKTEKIFDKWLEKQDDVTVKRYWHGSRNQNWFNILQTGLLIRPSGAIHTGSMFGDGIYGANKAQKSMNYSSLRGSYWTGGSDNVGYLALFKFHVGKEKKIKKHNSSCYSLNYDKIKREGYDSVYAQGGIDLRNDEFIVYRSEQVTIEYLVEIGN